MLALAQGKRIQGEQWAVMRLPADAFIPSPLPRTACIYSVRSLAEARSLLGPWMEKLSSVAWDLDGDDGLLNSVPRVCAPGELQRPVFPRLHDGRPMWASIAPVNTRD